MSTEQTSTGKPPIRTTLAPMLAVEGGTRAVEFYKRAFGAAEAYRVEDDQGFIVATLTVDGAEFWVAEEAPSHASVSPTRCPGVTARMILTVADPDAVFARAVAAGATVVVPVAENYGWRLGHVVDPFGHHWEIGHPLKAR